MYRKHFALTRHPFDKELAFPIATRAEGAERRRSETGRADHQRRT